MVEKAKAAAPGRADGASRGSGEDRGAVRLAPCGGGANGRPREAPKRGPRGGGRKPEGQAEGGRITVSPRIDEVQQPDERAALALAARPGRKAAGLLFTGPNDRALLLVACCDVHTVGMRHAIDVAFVDAAGRVVEAHRSVGPLRRLRNRKAVAVVERFASCDAPWFSVGDQVMISSGREVRR